VGPIGSPPGSVPVPSVPQSPLAVDSEGIWEATALLPEQLAWAIAQARVVGPLPSATQFRHVAVAGMGASGIAGDVLAAFCAPRSRVPVTVIKSADLPRSVGPETLMFAVSYSGDTQETLSVAEAAFDAGATVIALAAGGALAERAAHEGALVVPLPPDLAQPRTALGAAVAPPLVILDALGIIQGTHDALSSAVDQLLRRRDQLFSASSPAATLARRIGRTFPLIHGAAGLAAVAATRFKTQVNENAKSPAFVGVEPELCHNELAGWGQDGDVTRQILTLVQLRMADEDPLMARRAELVAEILLEVMADVLEVRAAGDGPLAQFFDLAYFGDATSLFLAAAESTDPGPVPMLADVKAALRGAAG